MLSNGSDSVLWPGELERDFRINQLCFLQRWPLCTIRLSYLPNHGSASRLPTECIPHQLPDLARESCQPGQKQAVAHPNKLTGQTGKFPLWARVLAPFNLLL